MRWRKLGRLYDPKRLDRKLVTHAANPVAIQLEEDIYRIFFSGRDVENRSSVGFIDADILRHQIIYVHDQPVFEHGVEGSYYSHGVSIGNCYQADGQHYMLFMGWQVPVGGHWRGDIGRLVIGADWSLAVDGANPLLGASAEDPISLSYPWVERDPQGFYRMWYGSTETWDAGNGEMLHVIKQAVSIDGHQWELQGPAIPFELGIAQAFSRPTVARSKSGGRDMWFSYRSGAGEKYRIGYAVSADGTSWSLRLGEAGIDVSREGWDSEMVCYPFVFDHKGLRYMLYNGNGYGRTGFGIAVLER